MKMDIDETEAIMIASVSSTSIFLFLLASLHKSCYTHIL
jgi:hypothetical protein